MINSKNLNKLKKLNKNIRQAYKELEHDFDDLANSYLKLQRLVKRILLEQEPQPLFFNCKTAQRYLEHEVDEIELLVVDNEETNCIELKLKPPENN